MIHDISLQNGEPCADKAVRFYVDAAAEQRCLDREIAEVLESSYREISVQVPIRRDDGSLLVIQGYRAQHNGAHGPYMGRLRYHPEAALGGDPCFGFSDDLEDCAP